MFIPAISDNNRNNTSFGSVIYKGHAKDVVQAMPKVEQEIFNRVTDRMNKSKYWDVIINSFKNEDGIHELLWSFRQKAKPHKILEAAIKPYKIRDNVMLVHSYNLKNDDIFVDEALPFKTVFRARKLKHEYEDAVDYYSHEETTPLTTLFIKDRELNMLEESYAYMAENNMLPAPKKTNFIIDKIKRNLPFIK